MNTIINDNAESYQYLSASMIATDETEQQPNKQQQANGAEKIMSEIYYA